VTRRAAACLAAAALFAGACGTEQQQAETETAPVAAEALPPEVARAVAVARGLEANPAAADSILTANGLTVTGLDSLMYRIAQDSALTAAYTNALR
jgi:hypothetical protein